MGGMTAFVNERRMVGECATVERATVHETLRCSPNKQPRLASQPAATSPVVFTTQNNASVRELQRKVREITAILDR